MALDVISWVLANGFTEESLLGGGAVAGKNCTISSIAPIDGGNRITFSWTLDNGTVQQSTLDVMDGDNGLGISKIEKINTLDLVDTYRITFTDNTTFDYEVTNGESPIITAERNTADDGVDIKVTNPDGTTVTTTVYDGKDSEIECEVVNEVLVYKDNSSATVVNETLVL